MGILSAPELTSFLGIDDSEDDARIATAVAAANQAVVEYCGRTFDKTATGSATARVFYPDSAIQCCVDDFWETTVLSVKVDTGDDGTYDTTLTLNTDFFLEPLNGLQHGQAWPYSRVMTTNTFRFPCYGYRPSVQVTAAWGWAAIPDAVKLATLIKAAKLFRRKDSIDGVLGGFADFTAVRISSREDPDVASLLGPFQRPELAIQVA